MAGVFDLDLQEGSTWLVFTSVPEAKSLPYMAQECGNYFAGANYYTQRQDQQNWLMLHTLSGCGRLTVDTETWMLTAGTVIVIDCMKKHRYESVSTETWHFQWIHFSGYAVETTLRMMAKIPLQIQTKRLDDVVISSMMDQISECYDRQDVASMFIISAGISQIMSILAGSLFRAHSSDLSEAHRIDMEQILGYIKGHYPDKITVSMLAHRTNMSKFHFMKQFKAHTGVSPYSYLTHYRINRAKEMLRSTNMPIAQIAEAVGYADDTNFIREFRKTTGQTPLQYRKKQG